MKCKGGAKKLSFSKDHFLSESAQTGRFGLRCLWPDCLTAASVSGTSRITGWEKSRMSYKFPAMHAGTVFARLDHTAEQIKTETA